MDTVAVVVEVEVEVVKFIPLRKHRHTWGSMTRLIMHNTDTHKTYT